MRYNKVKDNCYILNGYVTCSTSERDELLTNNKELKMIWKNFVLIKEKLKIRIRSKEIIYIYIKGKIRLIQEGGRNQE